MRRQLEIGVAITLTLLPQVLTGALFPTLRLTYLGPLIVAAYYRYSLTACLWLSLSAGLLVDLLTGTGRLGLVAAVYVAASLILYSRKQHLFRDSLFTIPILTALFALLVALLQLALHWSPSHSLPTTWLVSDLLVLPLLDGLYALFWFVFPLRMLFYRRQQLAPYRMPRPR